VAAAGLLVPAKRAPAALLSSFLDKGWARRTAESRSILFSPEGDRQFLKLFPVDP